MRVLSLYIAPLFLLGVSVFFLASYHIYSSPGGRYPKTIVVLEEGQRFWTAALDQGGADEAEVASETLILRVGLPALAIFLLAVAVYIHLKSRGKYTG